MYGVVMLVNDGFCLILLESSPSRVPANRKPPDNHEPDGPTVHICSIHVASSRNNQ